MKGPGKSRGTRLGLFQLECMGHGRSGGILARKEAWNQNVKARLENLLFVCLFLKGSEEP